MIYWFFFLEVKWEEIYVNLDKSHLNKQLKMYYTGNVIYILEIITVYA